MKTYLQLCFENPIVGKAHREGMSKDEIIALLCDQNENLFKDLSKQSIIIPRKIKMPDGSFQVWHCPDHLIPES